VRLIIVVYFLVFISGMWLVIDGWMGFRLVVVVLMVLVVMMW